MGTEVVSLLHIRLAIWVQVQLLLFWDGFVPHFPSPSNLSLKTGVLSKNRCSVASVHCHIFYYSYSVWSFNIVYYENVVTKDFSEACAPEIFSIHVF